MSGEGQITQLCSIPEWEPVGQSQSLHTVWYNLDHLILRSVYLLWRKIQSALLSNPRLVHWVVDVITMVNRCAPTKSISSTILCAFCLLIASPVASPNSFPVWIMVCRFLMTVAFLCLPIVPRNYFLVLTLACFLIFAYRLALSVSACLCYRLRLK